MSSFAKWASVSTIAAALFFSALLIQIYLHERAYLYPPRRSIRQLASTTGIPNLLDAEFVSRTGDTIRGWYVAPANGATIVLVHGSMGDRTDLIAEMRLLARGGFGALAFDWPGHGESSGNVRWGQAERDALTSALSWVAEQSERESRIGVLGFSLGGYVAAQVAAEDSRLRAVALVATPSDATELTRREHRQVGRLSMWLAELIDDWLFEPDTRKAIEMLPRISPRPLLLIGGDADPVVPQEMQRAMLAAAKAPKELWLVPNAGHGNYHQIVGDSYANKLTDFFACLL